MFYLIEFLCNDIVMITGGEGCDCYPWLRGVPLHQIQLFEKRHRDINKTAAVTLYKLDKAMCCRMEDLLEPEYENFC